MKGRVKKGFLFAGIYILVKWTTIGLLGTYLYKNGLWNNWFLLPIPVVGLSAFLIRKKGKAEPAYKQYFKKALQKYFPTAWLEMQSEVEEHFKIISMDTRFASSSNNPIDKRLDFSAYFLALIQTLEARNQSYDQIKSICLEVTYDYVSPKNNFQKWLKRVPAKLVGRRIVKPFIKNLHNKIIVKGHPDGFRAGIITDKGQTYNLGYGIDIFECGICKLFQKHNASRYASILCEVDKVTSNLAGLELIRNSTIALGAEKCDFRFKRVEKKI